jgi:hypothetical protein
MRRFHLSSLALVVLILAAMLGGIFNNALSVFLGAMGLLCWFATAKARGGSVLMGILAVCGSLLLAAVLAAVFRGVNP